METSTRQERQRILKEIDKLEIGRCGNCSGYTIYHIAVKCKCDAAVTIRKLGKQLDKTISARRNVGLEQLVEDFKGRDLTVEGYHQFKALQKSDRDIAKLLNWYYGKMVDFKFNNGLSNRKGPSAIDLTEAHRQTAKDNGIPIAMVRTRIRVHGWKVERATTESPNSHKQEFGKWMAVAESNGISKSLFKSRLNKGADMEDAATRPVGVHKARVDSPYDPKMKELAKANGISSSTFRRRVNELRWSEKRAATEPTQKREKVTV